MLVHSIPPRTESGLWPDSSDGISPGSARLGWRARYLWSGIAALSLHLVLWMLLAHLRAHALVWPLMYIPAMLFLEWPAGWPGALWLLVDFEFSLFLRWPLASGLSRAQGVDLGLLAGLILLLWAWRRRQIHFSREISRHICRFLSSMGEAVMIFSTSSRLLYANPPALRLLDVDWFQALGRSSAFLLNSEPDSGMDAREIASPGGLPEDAVGRVLRTRRPEHLDQTVRSARWLEPRHVVGSAMPLELAAGGWGRASLGAVVVLLDVTELRGLENRVQILERQTAIGQMAASISHDFNNILEVIQKSTVLLAMLSDHPAAERHRYLAMIEHAVQRGSETVLRLRDYMHGGQGERQPLDLNDIARDALDLIRPLWRARDYIQVSWEYALLPPVSINATDLRRVLTNLLLNALQAIETRHDLEPGAGNRHLWVTTSHLGANVQCVVEDDGIGIAAADQARIFHPFFTTKTLGTGLGLSESAKIILAHGGRLEFSSQPGQGARFTLTLPAASAAAA